MKKPNLDLALLDDEEKAILNRIEDFRQFLTEKQYNKMHKMILKYFIKKNRYRK